jgi:CubicO group peptidase (beta-lactamase class C family)
MFDYAEYPEELGISSKGIMDFLEQAEHKRLEFHSLLLLRHGKVACKLEWHPYSAFVPHTLFSLSKSFCSCAAGFAVSEGLLQYTDTVVSVLPDKIPHNPSKWLQQMTMGDLLCMGGGLSRASDSFPQKETDLCRHGLHYPLEHEPGTWFDYNTFGTYLVSAMVQRKTGMTCRDYLMPRLFDKLKITKPQWDSCPMGINRGGYGLRLACEDIAKFGQLLLQDGMWEGKRVLPEGWISLATGRKIDNYRDDITSDWQQGYGYQFWRTREGRYRGDGMFGQICLVDPAKDTVVAITAGIPDMRGELDSLHDLLLPAVGAPPANKETQSALKEKIKALGYPFPSDDGSGWDVTGSYLARGGKHLRVETLAGKQIALYYTQKNIQASAVFLLDCVSPHAGESTLTSNGGAPLVYLGAYGWDKGTLQADIRMPGDPGTIKARFTFKENTLMLTLSGTCLNEPETVFAKC